MGCLVILFALIATWLFTSLLGRAFDSWLIPVAGFLLLPWTTLAYVWMWRSGHRVENLEWFLVGFAFLVDLGAHSRTGRRD